MSVEGFAPAPRPTVPADLPTAAVLVGISVSAIAGVLQSLLAVGVTTQSRLAWTAWFAATSVIIGALAASPLTRSSASIPAVPWPASLAEGTPRSRASSLRRRRAAYAVGAAVLGGLVAVPIASTFAARAALRADIAHGTSAGLVIDMAEPWPTIATLLAGFTLGAAAGAAALRRPPVALGLVAAVALVAGLLLISVPMSDTLPPATVAMPVAVGGFALATGVAIMIERHRSRHRDHRSAVAFRAFAATLGENRKDRT